METLDELIMVRKTIRANMLMLMQSCSDEKDKPKRLALIGRISSQSYQLIKTQDEILRLLRGPY